MSEARAALVREARAREVELRDLACTLILVCAGEDNVGVAHVGDGAVVAGSVDRQSILSGPGASEYTNEVIPLTSEAWRDQLRVSCTNEAVRFLSVFTDGCDRAALRRQGGGLEAFPGFFGPLFTFVAACNNEAEGSGTIKRLLSSAKMSEYIDDDKTLVLAHLYTAWRE